LIKTALALHHGMLPPSRYATEENEQLKLAEKSLRLVKTSERLHEKCCFAGVSSFGLGGTNAHVVLASAPAKMPAAVAPKPAILTLTASDHAGLVRNLRGFLHDVDSCPGEDFARLAWSSNQLKSSNRHRLAIVAKDKHDALTQLRRIASEEAELRALSGTGTSLNAAWFFSGSSLPYHGMTQALHDTCGLYRHSLALVDETLARHLSRSILDEIFTGHAWIDRPSLAQPAVFAIHYAMGRSLLDAGIRPAWVAGEGIGQLAALALADVLTLSDTCRLATEHGSLMELLVHEGACPEEKAAALVANEAAWARHRNATPGPDYKLPGFPIHGISDGRFIRGNATDGRPSTLPPFESKESCLTLLEAVAGNACTHLIGIGPRCIFKEVTESSLGPPPLKCLALCPGPEASGLEWLQVVAECYRFGAAVRWDTLYEPTQRVRRRLTPYAFATGDLHEQGPRVSLDKAIHQPANVIAVGHLRDAVEHREIMEKELIRLIAEVGGYPVGQISRSTHLYDDLGYDSIVALQLQQRIELGWQRKIEIASFFADIQTVDDLVSFLCRSLTDDMPGHQHKNEIHSV
jgi:acyl carrier protein